MAAAPLGSSLFRNDVGASGSALVAAVKKHSKIKHINDEGTFLKHHDSPHGHALRTILSGECYATPW
jgi:hypothetical protein